jgi:polygalacturonase
MDRRHFIGMGGAAAALLGTAAAEAAPPPAALGKSVADLGVEPNAERDQSAVLQRAINELAPSGQPIVIPAGLYHAGKLQLPSRAAVFGVPGLSILAAPQGSPAFDFQNKQDVSLRGVTFIGAGLIARDCRNLTIADCQVLSSGGDGLVCSGSGLLVTGNRASACARAAIWIEGDGLVTNNLISGEGQFGLRLGSAWRLGTMSVVNNYIDGPQVGIAVSSSEAGYAFIAMNMIAGAKNGGIRALSGNDLIGKDLTRGGSEAFRNLAIAANVSL